MYRCIMYVYMYYVSTRSVRKVSYRIFLCEHLMDYNLARLHEPTLNLSAHAWIFSRLSIASVARRKANWIDNILPRKCLLNQRRRGRGIKQLLNDPKGRIRYCKLKEETLGITVMNSLWKRLWNCRRTEYSMNKGTQYSSLWQKFHGK